MAMAGTELELTVLEELDLELTCESENPAHGCPVTAKWVGFSCKPPKLVCQKAYELGQKRISGDWFCRDCKQACAECNQR